MNDTQKKVIEILRRNLTLDETNDAELLESDFQAMGVNSLNFIKIVVAMEEAFDLEFDDDDLNYNAFRNVNDIVALMEKTAL